MSPQPGEVWLADLGLAAKTRPVVIVSRQDPNPPARWFCTLPTAANMEESASFVQNPARSGSEPAPMITEGPGASVEAIATEAAASSVAQRLWVFLLYGDCSVRSG
jgi:hypothetical protein